MGSTNPLQPACFMAPLFFGIRPFCFVLPPAHDLGASSLSVTVIFQWLWDPPNTRDMQGVDLTGHERKAH